MLNQIKYKKNVLFMSYANTFQYKNCPPLPIIKIKCNEYYFEKDLLFRFLLFISFAALRLFTQKSKIENC